MKALLLNTLLCPLFLLLLSSPLFSSPAMSVEGVPRSGGFLLITIPVEGGGRKADGPHILPRGVISWQGKSFPLSIRNGSGATGKSLLEGIVPVPRETKQGSYSLTVTLEGDPSLSISRTVPVKRRWFGVQRLWLPESETSKYEGPEVEKEYEIIDRTLQTFLEKRLWKGNFQYPCPADLRTSYGIKRVINGEDAGWHRGIDLAAARGDPVHAANGGRVVLARKGFQLHGTTVILNHGDGISTLYIHLSSLAVREGEEVVKGQVIGRVGSTGVATGPHLHWGAYVHGIPVDPRLLLRLPVSWRER